MVRVTITDHQQTVSFPTSREVLLLLIAGCSVDPASLEDLLIAADSYQRGTAAAIMADLMEFDKALHRQGADYVLAIIAQSSANGEALRLAFQVIDETTSRAAFERREGDLVVIDLARKVIRPSPGVAITIEGEINLNTDKALPGPTVTYILPQGWAIQPM